MGFKKDIQQLKKTSQKFKEAGKKIEEKAPLVAETSKSVFVIIKWIVIVFIILAIIGLIGYIIDYPAEKRAKEEGKILEEKRAICEKECYGRNVSMLEFLESHSYKDDPNDKGTPAYQCYQKCLEGE